MSQLSVHTLVETYFQGRLHEQPAFRYLLAALPGAIILVTGSYSFGQARPGSDIDIEMIVPDEAHALMVTQSGGPRGLWVHDGEHDPRVDVKVRPLEWLRRRLNGRDPVALWVYQRAVPVQDPDQRFQSLLQRGATAFAGQLPAIITGHYRDFRSAVTIEQAREGLCRQVMACKAVESALVLPLLARQDPYPYPKWQSWWLSESHPRGNDIVELCHQMLDRGDTSPAFRRLRQIIDGLLDGAGFGERLVHDFWRKL